MWGCFSHFLSNTGLHLLMTCLTTPKLSSDQLQKLNMRLESGSDVFDAGRKNKEHPYNTQLLRANIHYWLMIIKSKHLVKTPHEWPSIWKRFNRVTVQCVSLMRICSCSFLHADSIDSVGLSQPRNSLIIREVCVEKKMQSECLLHDNLARFWRLRLGCLRCNHMWLVKWYAGLQIKHYWRKTKTQT